MRRSVLMTRLVIEFGAGRLDQDVDLLGRPRPAFGVADDPANRVAGGDRAGADELLALLQGDVGHLAGRCVDLIERAIGEGIDLDGVEVAAARRLDARGGVRQVDTLAWIRGSGAERVPGSGLSWPGSGSGLGTSTTCTGLGGSASSTAGWVDRRS